MAHESGSMLDPIPAARKPRVSGVAANRRLGVEDLLQDAADSLGLVSNEDGELILSDCP